MRHRSLGLAAALLAVALPAAAEVYTIRLTNGTVFESRYQPKQAAWDPTMVTFVDETGTDIGLPQALIGEVTAQSETKGYGRVIDTTTVDLGFMPNDLDQAQQMMREQAQSAGFQQSLAAAPFNQGQFVEPSAMGGGIPVGFSSSNFGGGGGSNPNAGGTPSFPTGVPAPFTTPTNTVTPAPFTTPSPASATPTAPGQQ